MKICPSCKSKIDDDARFCLYCMTSLDNKETIEDTTRRSVRPLIWLSVIAVICIIVAVLTVFHQSTKEPSSPSVDPITTVTSASTVGTTVSSHDAATSTSTHSTTVTPATTTAVIDNEHSSSVKYLYRPLESGDEFIAIGIERPQNGITIVDVEIPAEDGVYDIPAYIDGCPVLAIEEYAFCRPAIAPTVKTVYFPETMTTVNEFAFASCTNLSDVYYRNNIYIQGYAYPSKEHRTGALTIHCAEDCHNRNFRLHKNMVSEEDNTYYEEWNGE